MPPLLQASLLLLLHYSFLSSSSDYFWALFGDNMLERFAPSVSLPALTPGGLEAVLDFLYSGWLSLSPSTLPVVLEAARYLQVEAAVSNLLLSRLRFGLVATSDLAALSHAHRAMATPLVRSQLTRALEYHALGSAQPIRQSRQTSLRALPNRVLLVGGGAAADCPEQQMLTFDLRTRTFSSLASGVPRRLRRHCVCSVGGFLFVIGGEEVREGDEDGGKSVTVTTTNQEAGSMQERRVQFACCVVEDVIYAIGGRHTNPETNTRTSVASVEFYDMASGTWRRGATMPRPVYGHASAVLGNGIYVSGGLHDGLFFFFFGKCMCTSHQSDAD
uniref:Kelch like family member 34 n=1 Tax=Myripristis murdjan TaxID=586833 RepID=A0A668AAG2_9TELE